MAILKQRARRIERPKPGAPCQSSGPPASVRCSRRAWVLQALFFAVGLCAPKVLSKSFSELDVKAAFLYNFAQFVQWPPEAFPAVDTPFTIGILGTDPCGN